MTEKDTGMVIEAFSEEVVSMLGREHEEKAAMGTAFQVQGTASTKGWKREDLGLPKDRERARGVWYKMRSAVNPGHFP